MISHGQIPLDLIRTCAWTYLHLCSRVTYVLPCNDNPRLERRVWVLQVVSWAGSFAHHSAFHSPNLKVISPDFSQGAAGEPSSLCSLCSLLWPAARRNQRRLSLCHVKQLSPAWAFQSSAWHRLRKTHDCRADHMITRWRLYQMGAQRTVWGDLRRISWRDSIGWCDGSYELPTWQDLESFRKWHSGHADEGLHGNGCLSGKTHLKENLEVDHSFHKSNSFVLSWGMAKLNNSTQDATMWSKGCCLWAGSQYYVPHPSFIPLNSSVLETFLVADKISWQRQQKKEIIYFVPQLKGSVHRDGES